MLRNNLTSHQQVISYAIKHDPDFLENYCSGKYDNVTGMIFINEETKQDEMSLFKKAPQHVTDKILCGLREERKLNKICYLREQLVSLTFEYNQEVAEIKKKLKELE